MTGIGFIGTGGMGRHQADAFSKLKGVRVTAGADLSPASREAFLKLFPDATAYEDHRELLADKSVEGVVVSVPTGLHLQVASDALKAGVPVLCEKPLGRTVEQCRKMIEISKKTGTFLMTAHCRRFDADWGQMRKIVSSGKLGQPMIWRSMSVGMGPAPAWFFDEKLGGGPMIDGAVHNYDFATLLFGKAVSVIATAINLTGTTAVNTATAMIEYEKGDQMMLSWSWGLPGTHAGGSDILGSKGTMAFGAGGADVSKFDTKKYGFYSVANRKTGKSTLTKFTRSNMYVTQAKHFIECFKGKAECLSPPQEAIKAVAVAEAIFKSIKANGKRTKVTL